MSPPTSPPTTFRSLPPELVDEILCSSDLSNRDLVQCCLVSQQSLSSARRPLYSTITLDFDRDSDKDLYLPSRSTVKLLATIRQNPSLGRYCICLRVTNTEPSIRRYHTAKDLLPPEMIDEWFGLLPNLKVLWTPYFSDDRFRPLTLYQLGGRNWTTLYLDVLCTKNEFQNLSSGSTLKKLRCRDLLVLDSDDEFGFPSSVETLDLENLDHDESPLDSEYAHLHPPPNSRLRNLRIYFRPVKLVHLEEFSNLEYLSIYLNKSGDPTIDLTFLLKLKHLRRLCLEMESVESVKLPLQALFANFPRSIYRLNFAQDVPYTLLRSLLQPEGSSTICQLGLSNWETLEDLEEWELQELEVLKGLCEAKGVGIYPCESYDPVFDF